MRRVLPQSGIEVSRETACIQKERHVPSFRRLLRSSAPLHTDRQSRIGRCKLPALRVSRFAKTSLTDAPFALPPR